MDISRVLTLIVTVGFGAGLPSPAEIFMVLAVFIETEANPALNPPTRVAGRVAGACGFGGGGAATATGFGAVFSGSFLTSFAFSFLS